MTNTWCPCAIGAIGEILGAGAVVVSLVYLATQISQNTRSTHAATRDSISRSTIDVLTSISHDAESSKLYYTGLMNPDALEEDGVFRFDMMLYAVFESHESAFAQWKRGALTDSDWEKWKWIIGNYMAAPGVQRAWLARGLKPALSQEYQDYIEELGVGQGWLWMHRPPAEA